jgi:hypothetical protein
MHNRNLDLSLSATESAFLWGPRQTGKSTLLKARFPNSLRYDLLQSDVFHRLLSKPSLLREECIAALEHAGESIQPIIIDEVQKIPALLDEVHWLIENKRLRFILCGSSARKLKQGQANLLGGRAIRYELHPLTSAEIDHFDLQQALNNGLLPRHYASQHAPRLMQAYVGDYLKEEIVAEAVTRNIPAFSRFLEVAALCNGEMINYQNIATDIGVSAPSVKSYFQILEDTLIGSYVPAFRKQAKRRVILAPKFYLFDVGIANYLAKRGKVQPGSELFGKAFEHFLWMELNAHSHYSEQFYDITYWRTTSQIEVDFVIANGTVAIEAKTTTTVQDKHLRGLRAFKEEYPQAKTVVVSLDAKARKTHDNIDILPWQDFLNQLWAGKLVV